MGAQPIAGQLNCHPERSGGHAAQSKDLGNMAQITLSGAPRQLSQRENQVGRRSHVERSLTCLLYAPRKGGGFRLAKTGGILSD